MSWTNIIWSMVASACLTLAMVHLIIWFRQNNQPAHLLFSVIAVAVAAISACELLAMHAQTTVEFGRILWWGHLPVFFAVVSIVWFVLFYFRAGRPWLGYTVCVLRLVALIINFFSVPNLNYKQITDLLHLNFFGETISVAEGVGNPWAAVGELSSLLLLVFVVDASLTLWRQGDRIGRRRAVIVGGSVTFFILVAAGHSALLNRGLISSPYLISLPFLVIVAAMGYELSCDVLRAAQLVRQLQATEERLSLVVEASPNAIIVVNGEARIELANAQVEMVFGYTRRELVGLPVQMLIPELFDSQHTDHSVSYSHSPEPHAIGTGREFFGRRKNGSEVPIEIGLNPIHTAEGVLVLASIIDITQRRQAELEAARQRSELVHLSRVTLLGELSGSLAHELNQPLGAIVTNAGAALRFLARDALSREELREVLEDIASDGRRAGEVIRGIRGMARKKDAALQLTNLNDVITGVIRLTRSDALAHDCAVVSELHPMLPPVKADVVQVQQVFLNLILNAFEASQEAPRGQRQIIIRTERESDGTVLANVRDFGTGLPAEAPERIFDQFYSTKKDGMGIGLSIAQSIASAHGGTLYAQNAKGGGAEFFLRLPAFNEVGL
jgi:two-component system sensor kinase FixL